MALDFPASPAVGQRYASGASSWVWDGVTWNIAPQMMPTIYSDMPPANPAVGQFWMRGTNGVLYCYINDGNSQQWVQVSGQGAPAGDAGKIDWFAMPTPPTGWLKANGQLVSRTTYAALFAALGTTYGAGNGTTTFTLPDYRGVFPRAWADDGPTDAGRGLGTVQAGQNLSHNHTLNDPGHVHGFVLYQSATGGGGLPRADSQAINSTVPNTGSSLTGITLAASGGSEARPINVAMLCCIKY